MKLSLVLSLIFWLFVVETSSQVLAQNEDQNLAEAVEMSNHLKLLGDKALLSPTRSSASMILNRLTSVDIEQIALDELLDSQRSSLNKLLREFEAKSKGLSKKERWALIREFEPKLEELLLPNQLEAISSFSKRFGRVWEFVLSNQMSQILGLSNFQKRRIQRQCEEAETAITDAQTKIDQLIEKERSRVKRIFENLNEDQIAKLERILGRSSLEDYFDKMSLKELHQHVKLLESQSGD